MRAKVGSSLPPGDKHGVSVYIPTWEDTEVWGRRDPELIAQLKTGYPRFFVPLVVNELAERLLTWTSGLPWRLLETEFRNGLRQSLKEPGRSAMLITARHHAKDLQGYLEKQLTRAFAFVVDFDGNIRPVKKSENRSDLNEISVVVYPPRGAKEAKAFWQHTGFGISSRRATYWLENAPFINRGRELPEAILPIQEAKEAKVAIQQRIADSFGTEDNKLKKSDVLLYPTGMSAISHIHDIISLYTTTTKGTIAIFGFFGTQSDLETLEEELAAGLELCALFTEFPGNPLLGSVDLARIKSLSDQFFFLFVVDDTVGTSVNVDVISHCDVVCTSLTKMFSGGCNVMGGSVTLNPKGRGHWDMKRRLKDRYVNTYFPLDMMVMEENSTDFEERVIKASQNAMHIADTLRKHSSVGQVYYPKGSPTQRLYEEYKRPGKGYGYLLSIRFNTPAAAIAFLDALDVAKGPSLGTNFTLGCAYTLFAHFHELEWAESYGVVEHLVRISVGIENQRFLDEVIKTALDAAERASKK
ncbi:cystathionine beta-lyase [Fusarium subglutinans]|uniref:Cystathionine beta-lyase n=1 Tax=Gibberella subglutinans TaxID=42677 RepID=A0A8H5PUU4_GIBSU|nr:cystathionine beta-lyase [Fusarium subglutinans]KAF5602631.1 cystathionine beta-lyase [Fusarium subglutinans]